MDMFVQMPIKQKWARSVGSDKVWNTNLFNDILLVQELARDFNTYILGREGSDEPAQKLSLQCSHTQCLEVDEVTDPILDI